jgi:Ras-related protein Rab-18
MQYDEAIQLIVVGESTVGKTSILYKYADNMFNEKHLATVGKHNV